MKPMSEAIRWKILRRPHYLLEYGGIVDRPIFEEVYQGLWRGVALVFEAFQFRSALE